MASDDLRARIARIRSDAERSVHPDWRDINPTWVLLNEVDRLTVLNTELLDLVADFVDHDPCELDHHGYCQAHMWIGTDLPCPHGRAKELAERLPDA